MTRLILSLLWLAVRGYRGGWKPPKKKNKENEGEQQTMSSTRESRPIDWSKYPTRICQSLHCCDVCGESITLGQQYRDGGYGRRAHVACLSLDEGSRCIEIMLPVMPGRLPASTTRGGTVGGGDPDDADRAPKCEVCRGAEQPCAKWDIDMAARSWWHRKQDDGSSEPMRIGVLRELIFYLEQSRARFEGIPMRPMTEAARLKAKEAIRRLRAKQEGIDESWLSALADAHGQGQECERDRAKREITAWIQRCDETGMLDFAALKKIVEWGTPPEPRWKEVAKALAHGYEALRTVRPDGHDGDEESVTCYEDCQRCQVDAAMVEIDHALGLVCPEEPKS